MSDNLFTFDDEAPTGFSFDDSTESKMLKAGKEMGTTALGTIGTGVNLGLMLPNFAATGLRAIGERAFGGVDWKTAQERAQSTTDALRVDTGTDAQKQLEAGVSGLYDKARAGVGSAAAFLARNASYSPLGALAPNASKIAEQAPDAIPRTLGETGLDLATIFAPMAKGKPNANLPKPIQDVLKRAVVPEETPAGFSFDHPLPDISEQLNSSGLMPGYEAPKPPETALPTLNDVPVEPPSLLGTETVPEAAAPVHTEPPTVEPNYASLTNVKDQPAAPQTRGLLSLEDQGSSVPKLPNEPPVTTDFPLRQEVLEQPKIAQAIDAFRQEAARLQETGQHDLLAKLQDEFAAGMRQLGIDKPSDAYGRGLYENGVEPKLPIENTGRPDMGAPNGWNPLLDTDKLTIGGKFAKQLTKEEARAAREAGVVKSDTPMGRQRGAVDFSAFQGKGKQIKIEDAMRIALRNLSEAKSEHEQAVGELASAKASGDMERFKEARLNEAVAKETVDYAQSHHDSVQAKLASPKSEPIRFVPKNERGSVGDPEFGKFKNNLPEYLRPKASALYKEWKAMNSPKLDWTRVDEPFEKAVQDIPGLDHLTAEVAPIDGKNWETELKPIAYSQPDIEWANPQQHIPFLGKQIAPVNAGKWLYSGIDLTGFAKQNIAIRFIGDTVRDAMRKFEVAKYNDLIKKGAVKDQINGLKARDQDALWAHLQDLAKGGKGDDTLHPLAKKTAETIRSILDKDGRGINEVRALKGYKPMIWEDNYIPHRYRGDFSIPVLDKSGDFVTDIRASTRFGAGKARDIMKEKQPEYTYGNTVYKKSSLLDNNVDMGYRELLKTFEQDDPRIKTLQDAYEAILSDRAYETEGFKRHFNVRRENEIGGYEGNKEWLNTRKNAKEGLQAILKYSEQAKKWIEIQKADIQIQKVLSDPKLQSDQPNAMSYAKTYWDRASGKNSDLAKVINFIEDKIGEFTGIGRSADVYLDRILKGWMTMKYLGFNAATFMGSQYVQYMQMLPHWMTYLGDRGGGNAFMAHATAVYDLHAPISMMTKEGRAGLKWAADNLVFNNYMVDKIKNASSSKVFDALETFVRGAPSAIESYTRALYYLSILHQQSLIGKTGIEAWRTAAKITDMGMVNYHLHERPLMYRELGTIGDQASALKSYPHNQFTQLMAMFQRNPKAALVMMTTQAVFGGALGFYGVNNTDALIKNINKLTAALDIPMPYIPTIRETLLKYAPDGITFGGVSKVTGIDMAGRLGADPTFPTSATSFMLPFESDMAKMVSTLGEFAAQRNMPSFLKFAHEWSPASSKWVSEMADKGPDGQYLDPTTNLAQYPRNSFDWQARTLTGYSVDESRGRSAVSAEDAQTKWLNDMSQNVIKKIVESRDKSDIPDLIQRYVKYNPSSNVGVKLDNDLREYVIKQHLTPQQRAKSLPNINSAKNALQFMRGKDYDR